MSSPARTRLRPADAAVARTARGLPSWAAILITIVFGAGGVVVDRLVFDTTIGWGFTLCFVAGIALAALVVRRGSIFTAMVQAPIVMTLEVFVAFRFFGGSGTLFAASKVISAFPTMAVATGVGLLLGLVRIIAQPLRAPARAVPDEADFAGSFADDAAADNAGGAYLGGYRDDVYSDRAYPSAYPDSAYPGGYPAEPYLPGPGGAYPPGPGGAYPPGPGGPYPAGGDARYADGYGDGRGARY